MKTIERSNLLTALYQVESKGDLISQFDSNLSRVKGTATQRYIHLLEQVVFYSHAIIFGHGVQTAHNYRQSFMTTAKKNKLLKLSNEDVEKAFSFLNRTDKKTILKESHESPKNSDLVVVNDCVALSEINRLKADLDSKNYELAKGQKEEDKEIFIKVALVALSTGARLKDIMEDLTISTKKGVTYFDDGIKQEKGVILELDTKTVQAYIKAIRSHYHDRIAKGTDISTGIRKAIKRLKIPNSQNLNHLNTLYKQCLTSSTTK